jgi:uncharacterized protein (TIGR02246 family)
MALALAAGMAVPSPDFSALRNAWAQTIRAKQLDASVALYAPDGVFVLQNGTRFKGRAAIRSLYIGAMKMYDSNMTFKPLASYTSGDLAYDSGRWSEILTLRASGKIRKTTGSYMTVYRYENGRWLIIEQVWTSPDND